MDLCWQSQKANVPRLRESSEAERRAKGLALGEPTTPETRVTREGASATTTDQGEIKNWLTLNSPGGQGLSLPMSPSQPPEQLPGAPGARDTPEEN